MRNIKKTIGMSVAAVLSTIILVTTAMAASNNVSGYEQLKQSVFALNDILDKNYTAVLDVSLSSNGSEFLSTYTNTKREEGRAYSNKTGVTLNGIPVSTTETSLIDGSMISKDTITGTYTKYEYPKYYNGSYFSNISVKLSDNDRKLLNIIIDMLAGDTKNYFTNSDGVISVRLEKSQIPEFFQVLLAVMSEKVSQEVEKDSYALEMFSFDDVSEALVSKLYDSINDLSVESVYATGSVDEKTGVLASFSIDFTVTGKNKDGISHSIDTKIKYNISDIGVTKAEEVDLTGAVDANSFDSSMFNWGNENINDYIREYFGEDFNLEDGDVERIQEYFGENFNLEDEDVNEYIQEYLGREL